jgi:SNF2 family DNA or RNA helicase
MRRKLGVAKVKHSVSEIVDRIEAGIKPILVGAWHTDVIDSLIAELVDRSLDVGCIDGRVSGDLRDQMVVKFNDGTLDVLVGQIGAMGVAINMQGGSHIICVEEDWSPAIMDQFYARCHRIGQANHVHVDIFQSDTKLDQAVRRISTAKARGHNTLMAQGDAA